MVDAHCHLEMFEDLDLVLQRAWDTGLEAILTVAAEEEAFGPSLEIASRRGIYLSLGIHPHNAKDVTRETLKEIEKLASRPKVVAIGETGLDFYRNLSPPKIQEEVFRRHIEMANRLGLPLVLHCRQSYQRVLEILDEEGIPEAGGMVHCFSGDMPTAEEFLKRGFYISFSGTITYPKAHTLRTIAREVPLDRVLLETDAPFLSPQPYRGKRNEPAYIVETFKLWAQIREMSLDRAKEIIKENCLRLFRIREGGDGEG